MINPKIDKEKLKRIVKQMEANASKWISTWKELRNFINPTKGMFEGDPPNGGVKINHKILLDGSSVLAKRTASAGMTSGLTSASYPWFELLTGNPLLNKIKPVKMWLNDVTNIMLDVFRKSNFYESVHSVYDEVLSFGTASMLEAEDDETVVRFFVYTIGEYYLLVDSKGRVNGFSRRFWQNVEQLVDEYGIKNVSAKIKKSYEEGRYDTKHKVIHLILKNDKKEYGKIDNKNKAFISVHWEDGEGGNELLRSSGYDEFPIMAPRWETKNTNAVYGTGPGWDALGEVKMLQKERYNLLVATDKTLDPPVQIDASVIGQENLMAGGVTRFSSTLPNSGVKPAYQIKPDLQSGQAMIQDSRREIEQFFYYDLFLMLTSSGRARKTAREIQELHEEKFLVLGPISGKLENELLNIVINRTFNIILRRGMLPPAPPELQGQILKVEYISILAQAQRMVGASPIEQLVLFAGNIAQATPEAIDVLNADEALLAYGDKLGTQASLLRSRQEVKILRFQRQKAQQAQVDAEQAGAAAQGAKIMSETELGKNSALDQTLAAVQEGQ